VRRLYVDSSAFLALLRRTDGRHDDVAAHFARVRRRQHLLITSEAAVAETVTRLRYDVGLDAAIDLRDRLDADPDVLRVRDGSPALRAAAFAILEQHPRLRLSYADAMGAAVARDENVDGVFALDTDFRHLGFPLEPG
jgi:predicted nucleic acid-binding protein